MSSRQLVAAQRIEIGPLARTLASAQRGATLVVGSPRALSTIDRELLVEPTQFLGCARPHNPTASVQRARNAAERLRPDTVIAIGGASAIDLGKAVVEQVPAELVAVPTSLGGSEMSRFYGSRRADGVKSGGSDTRLLPGAVCYDPDLLAGLPSTMLFASGVNALAHALEAHYARREHWIATAAAEAPWP